MLLDALFYVLFALLDLFWWAVILAVVMNLLVSFQAVSYTHLTLPTTERV